MGPAVIPKPVTMTPGTGGFVVRASSGVSVAPGVSVASGVLLPSGVAVAFG